jgi:uncharacterized protein YjbI with pentapeptide repeats
MGTIPPNSAASQAENTDRPLLAGAEDVRVADHAGPWAAVLAALRAGDGPQGGLDLAGACLIDEDLSGLDLAGANLRGADLSRAKLVGARLFKADLAGATLFEADLRDADLSGADLTGANLQGVRAEKASFGHACLDGASLVGADLRKASLVDASLVDADLRTADLSRCRARGANWEHADLSRATLINAELVDGRLRQTRLDGADLRHAHLRGLRDFQHASWVGVDIREIDFTGAYLARRFIHDQNYLAEFRRQGRAADVIYWIWWLSSDCGRSILRWGACTGVLVLFYAWAYTLVGVNWGPSASEISPIYFSVVTMTTLGYGDIVPASFGAKMVAMSEVVTGYVMLGGLLSIFSGKMASRAD